MLLFFCLTKVSGAVDLLGGVGGLEGVDLTQGGVDARDDGESGHVNSKTKSKEEKKKSVKMKHVLENKH